MIYRWLLRILPLLFSGLCLMIQAQPIPLPLHRDIAWKYELRNPSLSTPQFSSCLPLLKKISRPDSNEIPTPQWKALGKELIPITIGKLNIGVSPLMNFSAVTSTASNYSFNGFNMSNSGLEASYGLSLTAHTGKNWSAGFRWMHTWSDGFMNNFNYYPTQDFSPSRINYFSYFYLPGHGLNYLRNSQNLYNRSVYESDYIDTWLAFTPKGPFEFILAKGKPFIGDGYRSLILSDNSATYPYFRINTRIGRCQYTNLFASMDNLFGLQNLGAPQPTFNYGGIQYQFTNYSFSPFGNPYIQAPGIQPTRKQMALQMLEVKLTRRWYAGFVEAIIWTSSVAGGPNRWDINYLNPIIFYHPLNFSLNSMGNALIALTSRYEIGKTGRIYGQFIIDDFNTTSLSKGKGFIQNKIAAQLGYRVQRPFGVKGFQFLVETNFARPYTYGNRRQEINYTHSGQALAHPAGANFFEGLLILQYQYKNLTLEYKTVNRIQGLDWNLREHYGSNIFLNESLIYEFAYNNRFLQGGTYRFSDHQIRAAFILSAPSALTAEISYNFTAFHSWSLDVQNQLMLGIKCQLYNYYRD